MWNEKLGKSVDCLGDVFKDVFCGVVVNEGTPSRTSALRNSWTWDGVGRSFEGLRVRLNLDPVPTTDSCRGRMDRSLAADDVCPFANQSNSGPLGGSHNGTALRGAKLATCKLRGRLGKLCSVPGRAGSSIAAEVKMRLVQVNHECLSPRNNWNFTFLIVGLSFCLLVAAKLFLVPGS